jgi:hypothetical protein
VPPGGGVITTIGQVGGQSGFSALCSGVLADTNTNPNLTGVPAGRSVATSVVEVEPEMPDMDDQEQSFAGAVLTIAMREKNSPCQPL